MVTPFSILLNGVSANTVYIIRPIDSDLRKIEVGCKEKKAV